MCVPVRSRSSRKNSSSSMRGSMLRSYSMPLTRTRTESLSLTSPGALLDRLFLVAAASGINMSYLDLFTSGSTSGNSEGTFYERGNQRSLVISRATHIGLWIGRSACCVRGRSNRLFSKFLAAKHTFSLGSAYRRQPHAAQCNRNVRAGIRFHLQLNCGAGARVHGSRALECQVCSACAFPRPFHGDLPDHFIRCKHRGVS